MVRNSTGEPTVAPSSMQQPRAINEVEIVMRCQILRAVQLNQVFTKMDLRWRSDLTV
jgi:hypothetical protein